MCGVRVVNMSTWSVVNMSRSWPGCDWWGCGCWQIGSSSPPPLWRSGVHCWPLHDCMTVHDNVAGDHSIINYQLPHHTWCSVNCLRINYDYPNTVWDYLWTECNKSMHNIQISSYWKGRCYCYHFLLTRPYFVDIKVKVSMLRLLSRDNIEMSKYRNADVDAIVMYLLLCGPLRVSGEIWFPSWNSWQQRGAPWWVLLPWRWWR